jgi:hypothetical protein
MISGVCAASIGLILTAAVILYEQELAVKSGNFLWFFLVSLIVTLSYGLLHYNYSILVVFLLGDIAYACSVLITERI